MKKEKIVKLFFIFITAVLVITLASKNSPLYCFNDWWDANAFMSVGKSWLEGIIPYRDLFEQKGPILYLIYLLASLVSKTSFIGVYILEIISLIITLIFVSKIINLFVKNINYNYLGIIIFAFSSVLLKTFGHGGSAEEFTIPLFMISLYYFIRYMKFNYEINNKTILLNGIIAGIVLWIKYSLLGFWFFFAASIFIIYVLKKEYLKAFYSSLLYLLGMFIVIIPILIYFYLNHAINDLVNVYFLVNINSYSSNNSIFGKILNAITLSLYNLISNPIYLLLIVIPLIVLFFTRKKLFNKLSVGILFIAIMLTSMGTYIGGSAYFYYGYIITAFNIIGILFIINYLKTKNIKLPRKYVYLSMLIFALILTLLNDNTKYMFWQESDYAQYEFKEIIEKTDNPTLLNYNCLDIGLYTTTGITPQYYYFMKNNISRENYPEMYNEQERYIKESKPMFVVTKKKEKILEDDYFLIKEHAQVYEHRTVTYYLYKKIL